MANFDVVHVREQGIDLIIVVVAPSFAQKATKEQNALVDTLTLCSHKAGLAGTVVPVWRAGSGFGFLAPTQWHAFFKSLTPEMLAANVNRRLTCG
jgi:hypothetical protein